MDSWCTGYVGMPVILEETVYGDLRKDFPTRERANVKRETPALIP
jgi:hypothetical protein